MDIPQNKKKGRPNNIEHICKCCQRQFPTAKQKGTHESAIRNKKAKTEIQNDDVGKVEDLFGTPPKKNIFTLGDNGAFSKFKQLQSAATTVALDKKVLISTSLGPNTGLNSENILIEKESSEEKKDLQGQGSSSDSFSQTSHQSIPESIEDIAKTLDTLQVWRDIEELVKLKTFNRIGNLIPSKELFFSFLIQCCTLEQFPEKFAPALAIAYKWLSNNNVPISKAITNKYITFFGKYKPHKSHSIEDLRILFKFCRAIQASVEWIKLMKDPQFLMAETAVLTGCCTASRLLFECRTHYSHEYFDMIDYIMEQSRLTVPNVDGFVKMIKVQALVIDHPWKDTFQRYASTENTYSKSKIIKIGGQILGVLAQPLAISLVMDIVELAINLNKCEQIKAVLKSTLSFTNINEFKDLLNLQVEKDKLRTAYKIQEEEQKEQEAKRQYETKAKEDERKKLMGLEKQRIEQQKLKEEQERQEMKVLEELSYKEKVLQIYKTLCEMNQQLAKEEDFLVFAKVINEIAQQLPIPIQVRPKQAALMFLMLTSKKQLTLIKLATGAGKSVMFVLMAHYLCTIMGKKVLVLVPSEVLKLDQTRCYYPSYCRVEANLYSSDNPAVYFQVFEEVLAAGRVSSSTVIFIDEFHDFFKLPARITDYGISCPFVISTSSLQVIGMSATFGGAQTISDIKDLIKNSAFIHVPKQNKNKKLEITITGKLSGQDIIDKATEEASAKSKELPVIIFYKTEQQLQKLQAKLHQVEVFAGETAEKLSMLTDFRKQQTSPHYIVLATADSVLGLTLFKKAYIQFIYTPSSLEELRQAAGRGERGEAVDAAIFGALFTEQRLSNINDLELALAGTEAKQRSLPLDYVISLNYLQLCIATTKPQIKTLNEAVTMLNKGCSSQEIVTKLSQIQRFKQTLTLSSQQEFKVPESVLEKHKEPENDNLTVLNSQTSPKPFTESKTLPMNVRRCEEEKDSSIIESLLGKRKEPEDNKKTKAGTKDIGSFFITPKRKQVVMSTTVLQSHEIIAAGISSPVIGQENILEQGAVIIDQPGQESRDEEMKDDNSTDREQPRELFANDVPNNWVELERQLQSEDECVVPFCGIDGDLCQLSCCQKFIHEACWKKNIRAQTLGLSTGPINELKGSMDERKKAPKTCPHCRAPDSVLLLEFNGIQFKILKKEQVECMFLNCFGVTARDKAAPHSFTHIARLSDMKSENQVGDSRTNSIILFGKEQSVIGGSKKRLEKAKDKELIGTKSVKSNASKNQNKRIKCDICGKEMRNDKLKEHRGGRKCKS